MTFSGFSWSGSNANGTIFIQTYPPPVTCQGCGSTRCRRASDGRLLCLECIDRHNRNVCIAHAEQWITSAFHACTKEQRSRLYRALSAVFHPDAGGDERLMQALNAAKERFL